MTVVIDNLSGKTDKPRHPEKQNRPDSAILRKPSWIRPKRRAQPLMPKRAIVKENNLVTVCEEAASEYRGVLGAEARHFHDYGRNLHPRLRLLQCRDRRAIAA